MKNKVRLLMGLLGVLLFILAINTLTMPVTRSAWLLSVLVSENGHWFALGTLAILALIVAKRLWKDAWIVAASFLMIMAITLFMKPSFDAATRDQGWRAEFAKTFGTSADDPWFRWGSIFDLMPADLSYERVPVTTRDGASIHYDFYRGSGEAPHPVVVVVHGGGWESGNSQQIPELNASLRQAGYSVASVGYRLSPVALWPKQREDVEDVISDLRLKVSELGLDMRGLYLLGRSAGGQISGALAFVNPPICIRGFIDFYSPTDLTFGYEVSEEDHWLEPRRLISQFMGGDPYEAAEAYRTSSIVENVSPQSPPSLLLHGRPDSLSWIKHAERLHARLKHAGVPSQFIDMPWGHHGFDYFTSGPGGQVSRNAVLAFLKSQKTRCAEPAEKPSGAL